jgi:hypothetical protein
MEDRKRKDLVAQVRSQYALENSIAKVGDIVGCEHCELEVREIHPVMHAGRPQAAYWGEVVCCGPAMCLSGSLSGQVYQDEIRAIRRRVKGAWIDLKV